MKKTSDLSGFVASWTWFTATVLSFVVFAPKDIVSAFLIIFGAAVVGLIAGSIVASKENKGDSKNSRILNKLYSVEENLTESIFNK